VAAVRPGGDPGLVQTGQRVAAARNRPDEIRILAGTGGGQIETMINPP
jgi:hypothetical protein